MSNKPTPRATGVDPGARRPLGWKRAAWRGTVLGTSIGLGITAWRIGRMEPFQRLLTGLDSLKWLILALLVLIAALIWLVFFSSLSRRCRAFIASVSLLAVVVSVLLFRLEDYSGSLFPQLVWRWTPTAPEELRQYLEARHQPDGEPALQAPGLVDLAAMSEHDYPGFLGAGRLGVVSNLKLARDWQADPPRELWRHAVGQGWSSFAVVGQYAVTQEQRGPEESVVCYELRTGRERWIHGDPVRFDVPGAHGPGPRATPTIHRGKVYTMGGTGLVNCLEGGTGKVVWQKALLPDPPTQNLQWGMAGSPLVVGTTIVVSPGALPGRSVVALDLEDGREVWTGGDDPAAYASPQLAAFGQSQQILVFNGAGLAGHDAGTGKRLWLFPWVTQGDQMVNVAQPAVLAQYGYRMAEPLVLITSGYGKGCALLSIDQRGQAFDVRAVWQNTNLKSKFSNVVVCGGYAYGLDDGVLACLDLADGSRRWKKGRYGHGQLLLVGDLLLVQSEKGDVVLVEPSPGDLNELGRIPALPGKTWSHLTLAGSVLLARNDRMAACYELPLAK